MPSPSPSKGKSGTQAEARPLNWQKLGMCPPIPELGMCPPSGVYRCICTKTGMPPIR